MILPLGCVNNIKTGRDKVNMSGESMKTEQNYLDGRRDIVREAREENIYI